MLYEPVAVLNPLHLEFPTFYIYGESAQLPNNSQKLFSAVGRANARPATVNIYGGKFRKSFFIPPNFFAIFLQKNITLLQIPHQRKYRYCHSYCAGDFVFGHSELNA